MRFKMIVLMAALPAWAFAAQAELKDKYLSCNCHVTPGVASLKATKPKAPKAPHAHHKASHKSSASTAAVTTKIVHTASITHNPSPKVLRSVTPTDSYPGRDAIVPSNKLALPAGKAIYAPGELVFLSGRVLDENCVPVSDAIVDIWQLNPEGKYVRSALGDRVSPDPHFTGSGRAVTNNLGQFNFVTLFPGTKDGYAPHINVHVIHKYLGTLDTRMFFDGDKHNADDIRLSNMPGDQRKLLMAKVKPQDPNDPEKGLTAEWDISLRGKNPWRHY